tara:strand:+ start:1850 stop:2122 length:273 start_codon:yes stop_codon:yes gene_type:complete
MKITKKQLMEIIEEAMTVMEDDEAPEPGGETMSDVGRVLTYIDKIDNYKEYGQLLQKILEHEVRGKDVVMRKVLGNQIANAILKKLGGSK